MGSSCPLSFILLFFLPFLQQLLFIILGCFSSIKDGADIHIRWRMKITRDDIQTAMIRQRLLVFMREFPINPAGFILPMIPAIPVILSHLLFPHIFIGLDRDWIHFVLTPCLIEMW